MRLDAVRVASRACAHYFPLANDKGMALRQASGYSSHSPTPGPCSVEKVGIWEETL
jgi:hypothetical protein